MYSTRGRLLFSTSIRADALRQRISEISIRLPMVMPLYVTMMYLTDNLYRTGHCDKVVVPRGYMH